MDYQAFFQARTDGLKRHGNYRRFAELERSPGKFPHVSLAGGHEVTVWCSNDYLGMGQSAPVIAAMHAALDQNGAGAGGTRNISGTGTAHVALERALAGLHGKEAALLFNSGYMSKLGEPEHARLADPRLRRLFGRLQPRLDDRGHPPQPRAVRDLRS